MVARSYNTPYQFKNEYFGTSFPCMKKDYRLFAWALGLFYAFCSLSAAYRPRITLTYSKSSEVMYYSAPSLGRRSLNRMYFCDTSLK
jgi:hypothetical protein